MILVDSSIWIDHLRAGDERLAALLERGEVASHAFVIGELACGLLRNRDCVLDLLADLPRMTSCTDGEVLFYIARHALAGRGIGYVEAHLLAAVTMHGNACLWTRDRRLQQVASDLGIDYAAG